ncbi:tetratricopeptide repeat protein [uncultured Desulfobulbus sp.]|uniref:tetratricopeptide repeat protein n=1 Tax=uncultured Desulfobulbus sp. TaxID=239745 RepID=UPI0029C868FC|nr:tetratricopeptide repeat protein [uncultured Desulfobulbus sp.]
MKIIVDFIKEVFPNIYGKYKVHIWASLLLVSAAFWFFNTEFYQHWRHFDEGKFKVVCSDFPPIAVDDNNFYFKYFAFLSNEYHGAVRITDVRMEFQSKLNVNTSETLLSDVPKNLLRTEIKDNSVFLAYVDLIEPGQAIGLSIDCSRKREGYLVASEGATVNLTYKVLGKRHNKSLYLNPASGDFSGPKKEEIVFDVLRVLDQRNLPQFPFSYEYAKLYSKIDDRTLRVYCPDPKDRFLRIRSESPSGTIVLESERYIHKDFVPIRIQVTGNNEIRVHSWLGRFRLAEAAEYFRKALQHSNKGDFKSAAAGFKKASQLDSGDYQAWFNLGLSLERDGDYQPAVSALLKAIEVKGDYFKAHGELATVLMRTGDRPAAARHLEKAIQINPKYAFAYYTLACLQKCEGKSDEAIKNFDLALKYEADSEMRDKYLKAGSHFTTNCSE